MANIFLLLSICNADLILSVYIVCRSIIQKTNKFYMHKTPWRTMRTCQNGANNVHIFAAINEIRLHGTV